MARGATHPTDDRRVRDRVFRRIDKVGRVTSWPAVPSTLVPCHRMGIRGFRMIKSRNDPD